MRGWEYHKIWPWVGDPFLNYGRPNYVFQGSTWLIIVQTRAQILFKKKYLEMENKVRWECVRVSASAYAILTKCRAWNSAFIYRYIRKTSFYLPIHLNVTQNILPPIERCPKQGLIAVGLACHRQDKNLTPYSIKTITIKK